MFINIKKRMQQSMSNLSFMREPSVTQFSPTHKISLKATSPSCYETAQRASPSSLIFFRIPHTFAVKDAKNHAPGVKGFPPPSAVLLWSEVYEFTFRAQIFYMWHMYFTKLKKDTDKE